MATEGLKQTAQVFKMSFLIDLYPDSLIRKSITTFLKNRGYQDWININQLKKLNDQYKALALSELAEWMTSNQVQLLYISA